jgi:hypothetical protein
VKRLSAALAALLALLLLAGTGSAAPPARVVAIGDVHGGYEPFVRLLAATGLTDAAGHWTGGRATLVQLGDAIDRGPDDRRVLDLLMNLERQAKRAGGRSISLLGNHEIMNLLGDWRYVAPESIASFGGAAERRAAFAPRGHFGRWLRQRPALVKLGDLVLLHGGVSPALAPLRLRGIAARAPRELGRVDAARRRAVEDGLLAADADFDALMAANLPALLDYPSWTLGHIDGPFWFRGYAEWSDAELAAQIPGILERLGARQIVVGHTPQLPAAIRVRAGGRVFLIDTGMLDGASYPGGAPIALEIAAGRFSAIDASGKRALLHEGAPAKLAAPP